MAQLSEFSMLPVFRLLRDAAINVLRKPEIMVLSLILYLWINLASWAYPWVDISLTTNFLKTLGFAVFSIVVLAVGTVLFSLQLCLLLQTGKERLPFSAIWKKSMSAFGHQFIAVGIVLVSYALGNLICIGIAGASIPLWGFEAAKAFLFLLLVLGLLFGFMIFLTFTSPFVLVSSATAWRAIGMSINLTKKTYLSALVFMLSFFVLYQLTDFIPNILAKDLVKAAVLFPWFVSGLMHYVQHHQNHDI